MRAANDIGSGERFDLADMMEQVRAERRFLRFFEKHTRVPAVGQMGSLAIAKTVLPGCKDCAIRKSPWRFVHEVAHVDEGAGGTLAEMEREYVISVLRETNSVISAAANRLGVPRTTLNAMTRKLGVARKDY
jgi:transcriptional regulator with GAF, ATPase, and Fis domain